MMEMFEAYGLHKLREPVSSVPAPSVPVEIELPQQRFYCWGGKIDRLLPQDFAFPRTGKPREMWNLFVSGDRLRGIPPLRLISSEHVADKNTKKRFSDFKVLMRMIEEQVRAADEWTDATTLENASRMYEIGKSAISLDAKSNRGYSRRVGALTWRTVLKTLQSKKGKASSKRRRSDNLDLDDSEPHSNSLEGEDNEEEEERELSTLPRKRRFI